MLQMDPLNDTEHKHSAAAPLPGALPIHKIRLCEPNTMRQALATFIQRIRHMTGLLDRGGRVVINLAVRTQPRPPERQVRLRLHDQGAVRVEAGDGRGTEVQRDVDRYAPVVAPDVKNPTVREDRRHRGGHEPKPLVENVAARVGARRRAGGALVAYGR